MPPLDTSQGLTKEKANTQWEVGSTNLSVFYHIGTFGDWQRMVTEQLATLRASGLYGVVNKVQVGIVGKHSADWKPPAEMDKVEVVARATDGTCFIFLLFVSLLSVNAFLMF
jgi:hypothetical protein